MKLESEYFDWVKTARCPCCGIGEFKFINNDKYGIMVNCESKGRFPIEGLWMVTEVCRNPLCEWSKVKLSR